LNPIYRRTLNFSRIFEDGGDWHEAKDKFQNKIASISLSAFSGKRLSAAIAYQILQQESPTTIDKVKAML
jgi:hypothetical protein